MAVGASIGIDLNQYSRARLARRLQAWAGRPQSAENGIQFLVSAIGKSCLAIPFGPSLLERVVRRSCGLITVTVLVDAKEGKEWGPRLIQMGHCRAESDRSD